jgi:hypothetical protein
MRQRGRKSVASLAVVVPDVRQQRPPAPATLSAEERVIWHDIVGKLRADWFQGCEVMLEIFVRSIVLERFVTQQIKATDPSDSQRLASLMRCQRDTAAVIASYATKMRLTPRASFDRTAPKLTSP